MSKFRRAEQFENSARQKTANERAEIEFGVPADRYRSTAENKASHAGAFALRVVGAIAVFALVFALSYLLCAQLTFLGFVVSLCVGVLMYSCTHVVLSWERFVVLRFGKYNRLIGPGLAFTIPLIEYVTLRVDQRTRITPFGAEEALTSDVTPLDVDAVLSWIIWDPEKACTEVEDVNFAVALAAQTALRDAIGRAPVSEVIARRNQLDKQIRSAIEDKVSEWGVTVLAVEIRNIILPQALQDSMALEAQAERRCQARLELMESEKLIAELLVDASEVYKEDPRAFELRKMHLVHEGMLDDKNSMVVPSAYTEGFSSDKTSVEQGYKRIEVLANIACMYPHASLG